MNFVSVELKGKFIPEKWQHDSFRLCTIVCVGLNGVLCDSVLQRKANGIASANVSRASQLNGPIKDVMNS